MQFREPYQVLITADMIQDTMKLELERLLEKAMHGKVKTMITSCCIRILYQQNTKDNKDPILAAAIEKAKSFERCRCGHLMDEEPLSPEDCLMSVLNVKGKGNIHRYFLATQDLQIRQQMRQIPAVPLIYCKRSVIILEPMSDATSNLRRRDEVVKYRDGIKSKNASKKRKREEDEALGDDAGSDAPDGTRPGGEYDASVELERKKKKTKQYGKKGPNPLSVKKPKKKRLGVEHKEDKDGGPAMAIEGESVDQPRKKRKRRKRNGTSTQDEGTTVAVECDEQG